MPKIRLIFAQPANKETFDTLKKGVDLIGKAHVVQNEKRIFIYDEHQ